MRCIVFSNNKKKLTELHHLLGDIQLDIWSYKDILSRDITVIEDGLTFEQNAIKKVTVISQLSTDILVADDSGLEVKCLNGRQLIYKKTNNFL